MAKNKQKKKPRKPNLKNPNSRTWKKKADDAWKEQILAVGYCEICGRPDGQRHSHHIITRTRLRFRHDISNGVCLCAHCHNFSDTVSPHVDCRSAAGFLRWLEEERPGQFQWYEENKDDMRLMEGTYRDKYEELTK